VDNARQTLTFGESTTWPGRGIVGLKVLRGGGNFKRLGGVGSLDEEKKKRTKRFQRGGGNSDFQVLEKKGG